MAVSLSLTGLEDSQQKWLMQQLTIQPEKKKKSFRKKFYSQVEEELPSLYGYQITATDLLIPFQFAGLFTQKAPNDHLTHPVIKLNFTGTLRDYQESVYTEIISQLAAFRSSSLFVYPGFGKTMMGAKTACELGLLTCVLMTMTILLDQWKNTFSRFTDAGIWTVGEKMPYSFGVILCMADRWHHIPEEIRKCVGFLIVDEAHMFCTPTRIAPILAFTPKFILLETATPRRSDTAETFLYSLAGLHNVIRKFPRPVYLSRFRTGFKPERQPGGEMNFDKFQKSMFASEARNQSIVSLVGSYLQGNKFMIVSALKAHVDTLVKLFKQAGISVDYLMGTKKKYSESQVLIGNYKKIATGFDEASFCEDYSGVPINIIIIVCTFDDPALFIQTCGRGLRAPTPWIICMSDDDKTCENHWKNNVKTARSEFPNLVVQE